MPFTPKVWAEDDPITPAELNRIETGVDDAHAGDLDAGAIGTAVIANLAVTTGKLANAAVTTAKIGDAQVTNAKVADGISPSKVSPHTVGAVGTYALLHRATQAVPGNTYSTGLSYSSAAGDTFLAAEGTWRCMGAIDSGGGVTLFVRVS